MDKERETATATPRDSKESRNNVDVVCVNEQVDKFLASLQEPKYQTVLSGDELSGLFQSFYDQTEEELQVKLGRKQCNRTLDAIERSLCINLYDKLFEPASDLARVQRFDERMRELRRNEALLDKLDLDISATIRPQLEPTIAYLSTIDRAKVPQEKLYCISQVNKMIVDVFKDTASGDVILPVLIYCILACPVQSLWKHSCYARRFRRQSAIKGQAAYCLTNFEAAIYFLETFSVDELPPDVDPALFRSPSRSNSEARLAPGGGGLAPGSGLDRSRSNSVASELGTSLGTRSRSNSLTPIRSRIGTIGASMGASVSKYLFTKMQQTSPSTIAEVRQKFESDSMSVSTGEEVLVNQKFMAADAESLTIGDVRQLLADYKRLANYVT